MAVRFVIGRAGTGKTHHCLAAVRRHLQEPPDARERLVLLVPEQASLQTERALLSDPAIGATTRAEVLSFRRLAHRILLRSGPLTRRALSGLGRAMALRHLLGPLRDRLVFYRGAERSAGFIEQLARTVGELMDEAVCPGDLAVELAPSSRGADDPLAALKNRDLRLIYEAYLEYLGADKLDPSGHLELARERIPRCGWLRGARIWADGFAGFTGQQVLTLAALAKVAEQIEITAMIDPEYAGRAGNLDRLEPGDLFAKTQRMYLDVRRVLAREGVPVDPPLLLRPVSPPRFAPGGHLAGLEQSLFAEAPAGGESVAVTIVEASDRRAEVDYVVSLLCHFVRKGEGRVRYRDIAIIVRDLEPYHDLLSAALGERQVPFFMDRRRPTSHHPLVELLRGWVRLAETDFSREAVWPLLRTDLLGLDRPACDALENYLLAHRIEGAVLWRQPEDWTYVQPVAIRDSDAEVSESERRRLEEVNRARRLFLSTVADGYDAAKACPVRTGREWVDLLADVLRELGVMEQLGGWAARAEQDGDLDLAEQHRQIVRDTADFLDELRIALGEESMDVRRLGDVLDAGLSQFTLGLAPPMLDQVLVGSVERSRHPEIKIAVVMGFNEGLFPSVGTEDSILNDEDRERLGRQGVRIGLTRRQRMLEEPLLAYTAMTRASERVVVTYAAADEAGKALRPSPYVQVLQAACGGLEVDRVDDGTRSRSFWRVRTSRDLAAHLALELRGRPPLAHDDPDLRTRWNDLYEASRRAEGLPEVLGPVLSSLGYVNDAALTPASARRIITDPLRASVSRLETFAACPFKHFARYGLRLEPRKLAALADVDVGTVHHAILEHFVSGLVNERRSLSELDEADIRMRLDVSNAAVTAGLAARTAAPRARDAYLLRRSAAELARVLDAQARVARRGRFRPRGAEIAFGREGAGSWPALEIRTPAGRRVLLGGFIDRVDLAELADEMLGVVIDYKRTRDKRLDLSQVYHGLSLQLLGYLLVLAEQGSSLAGRPVQPVGAFYVSLVEGYESVDYPDEAGREADGQTPRSTFAPRGLLNADRIGALDTGFSGHGRSEVYNVFVKTDGELGNLDSTDAARGDDFAALLEHTRRRLGEFADQIIGGDVRVLPYRLGTFSPCSWCDYRPVCRFEFGASRVRHLDPLKRLRIFEKVRGARSEERG